MQALKLKGWIDPNGNLRVDGAIALPEGEVELVVWHIAPQSFFGKRVKTKVKSLQSWFESTEPVSEDFDPDEARWEALKEKYDL
jgi:hypothetical protein